MTQENKVAELMNPRYKVIADFPDNINPIGTIRQNSANQNARKGFSSKYKGVSVSGNSWVAQIGSGGSKKYGKYTHLHAPL